MVIFFHKSSLGSSIAAILLLVVGFWLALGDVDLIYHQHALLQQTFTPSNQHLAMQVALAIAIVAAAPLPFIFNRMYNRDKLLELSTYLPLLVFVLLFVLAANLVTAYSTLIGVLFTAIAFYQAFFIGEEQNGIRVAFNCGLLIGIGSLFHFSLLFMLAIVFNALFYQRKFYWREWLAPLIGAALPLLFVLILSPEAFTGFQGLFHFSEILNTHFSTQQIIVMSGVGVVVIVGIPVLLGKMQVSTVSQRKSIYLFAWMAVVAGAVALLTGRLFILFVFSIPFSTYVICNFLLQVKRKWVGEVAFFILFAMVVYNQLKDYLNFNI